LNAYDHPSLVKYPRTFHLPWSPGLQNDDRLIESLVGFAGHDVVVTEKMDGENTTLYRHHLHARSLDSRHHPSRNWVKALHGRIAHDIPEGWRVCGENLYARHSIAYDGLPGYFLVFNIWNAEGTCLSWDETVEYAALLDLPTVPVLYRGPWDEDRIRQLGDGLDLDRQEGYVVRVAGRIPAEEFGRRVAKYVRQGHVQTDAFWMNQPVVPNQLKE